MQNLEPHKLIEASALFRNLQPHETDAISERLRPVAFARGAHILERGVWHGQLYIIASGQVSILLQEESGEVLPAGLTGEVGPLAVAHLGAGECFGEMSLITGEPPSATVRADQDSTLWALTQADFLSLIASCPTLLRNINAILSLRLARTNQQILLNHMGERIWLSVLDDAETLPRRALAFHIAHALAARSRKRVLLFECCAQQDAIGPRFAGHKDQVRPSLQACVQNRSLLQAHRASTLAGDYSYPALAVLTDDTAEHRLEDEQWLSTSDILAHLADLAHLYDYLLLVTTQSTPSYLTRAIGEFSTGTVLLVSATLAHSDRVLTSPSSATSVFVTHVSERPTIGVQDRYAGLLRTPVKRLLSSDLPLLEQSWEQRSALEKQDGQAELTKAVDFVARHIAHQTVGIAFGGGGARGFAHLGVLERLLARNVPIDYIAACSSGIIAPGMYLVGKTFAESEEIFLQIQRHIVQWRVPRTSIFSNKGLKQMLRSLCGDLRFEDLTTPFGMVAIDLAMRSGVVLDRGPLWQAGLASVALPGIFPPVLIGEHILMDAGMHDPVPIRLVHKMGADILLASELGGQEPPALENASTWLEEAEHVQNHARSPHIVDLLLRTYDLAMATIGMHSIREADVVIRPRLHRISLRQFSEGRKFVVAGREAVEQSLPDLRQHLPWLE